VIRAALTGGIATGKSHVLAAFARLGVSTIDADTLAHGAIAAGTPGAAAVLARFGQGILLADGSIDRRALGAIVFNDVAARHDLEAIVHPAVYAVIDRWFQDQAAEIDLAVADIPLLFETAHEADFDVVIVAACPPAEQLRRLMDRDRLSEADARSRIAAQLSIEEKVRRANYVVWTTGTTEETARQVEHAVEEIGFRR
jgi:dephospho-CoA kinase